MRLAPLPFNLNKGSSVLNVFAGIILFLTTCFCEGVEEKSLLKSRSWDSLILTFPPALTAFNQTIKLTAWRNGNDKDGRQYAIIAKAFDNAGNLSEKQAKQAYVEGFFEQHTSTIDLIEIKEDIRKIIEEKMENEH